MEWNHSISVLNVSVKNRKNVKKFVKMFKKIVIEGNKT